MTYFHRGLQVSEETENPPGIATSLAQIGYVHEDMGNLDEALSSYTRSVDVFKSLNHQNQVAVVLISIGDVFQKKDQPIEARNYYIQSKGIYESLGVWDGLATSLTSLGESHRLAGKHVTGPSDMPDKPSPSDKNTISEY